MLTLDEQYQFDMVRLGIGLYGVSPVEHARKDLLPVNTLRTVISQVKTLPPENPSGTDATTWLPTRNKWPHCLGLCRWPAPRTEQRNRWVDCRPALQILGRVHGHDYGGCHRT